MAEENAHEEADEAAASIAERPEPRPGGAAPPA